MNSSSLKAQKDRVAAAVLLLLGILVLIVGYFGVSDVPFASQQIPYVISAGIGGVFLLGVAGTLWLSADLQDEWRKLHRLEEAVRELTGTTSAASAAALAPAPVEATVPGHVVGQDAAVLPAVDPLPSNGAPVRKRRVRA